MAFKTSGFLAFNSSITVSSSTVGTALQLYEPETYKAFLRRITEIKEIKKQSEETESCLLNYEIIDN